MKSIKIHQWHSFLDENSPVPVWFCPVWKNGEMCLEVCNSIIHFNFVSHLFALGIVREQRVGEARQQTWMVKWKGCMDKQYGHRKCEVVWLH